MIFCSCSTNNPANDQAAKLNSMYIQRIRAINEEKSRIGGNAGKSAVYFVIAEKYRELGMNLDAIEAYKIGLSIGEDKFYIQRLIDCYIDSNQPDEALNIIRKLEDIQPNSIIVDVNALRCLLQLSLLDDARIYAENLKRRITSSAPEDFFRNWEFSIPAAEFYAICGENENAMQLLDLSYEATAKDGSALFEHGMYFLLKGENERSLSLLNEYYRTDIYPYTVESKRSGPYGHELQSLPVYQLKYSKFCILQSILYFLQNDSKRARGYLEDALLNNPNITKRISSIYMLLGKEWEEYIAFLHINE